MSPIDCLLRIARLELDIYGEIVSPSIEDFLNRVPQDVESPYQISSWQSLNRSRHYLAEMKRQREELLEAAKRREVTLTAYGRNEVTEGADDDA